MDPNGLADDLADRHARIERGVGVLKDDLQRLAVRLEIATFELGDRLAFEADLALRRVLELQDDAPERGLAATGFADEADCLSREHRQVDVLQRLDLPLRAEEAAGRYGKIFVQPFDLDDGRGAGDLLLLLGGGGRQHGLGPQNLRAPAGAGVARLLLDERRRLTAAAVLREPAARGKTASSRRRHQVRRQALDRLERRRPGPVEARDGTQEPARVGMLGMGENRRCRSGFDDARRVHDVHAVGVAGDDAEVVRDDDGGDVEPAGEVFHKLQDLRLDGDIEGGRRLVRDQHLGIAGEPDGDHDALAHATGELVRVLIEAAVRVGDADEVEQLAGARSSSIAVHVEVDLERLHDLLADRQHRIERCHRLLENHGDVAAPERGHLRFRDFRQVAALEQHAAAGDARGDRMQEAHHGERGDGLARARLSDDRHHFAAAHVKGYALDRAHGAARGHELDLEIANGEEGGFGARRLRPRFRHGYDIARHSRRRGAQVARAHGHLWRPSL